MNKFKTTQLSLALLIAGASGTFGAITIIDFEAAVGRQGETAVTYTGNLSGGPSYAYDSIVSVDLGNPAPNPSTANLGSGMTLQISGPGQHGTWTANNQGGAFVPVGTEHNDALVNGYLWIRDNVTFTFTLSGFNPTDTVTVETMESQKNQSILFSGGPLLAPVTTNQLFEADSDNATAFQTLFTTTGSTSYSFNGTNVDSQGQLSAMRITVTPIPEPSLGLLGALSLGLAFRRRRLQ